MRLVFAGTPEPALPALDALIASPRHEVVAVVTRPDAPAGRGRTMRPSPVRQRAEEHDLEVLTPVKPSEPEFQARLKELGPDCCPVVAYGALIPTSALEIPPLGWINLHFSILPAWRGAAPVQRAIMAGDDVTGASTFRIEAGLDTGDVFGVLTTSIGSRETAGDLLTRLAVDGAQLLVATLDGIEDGQLVAVPQSTENVSLAPKVTVEDARIEWRAPAAAIDRQIRGCTPAPGAWTTFRDQRMRIGPVLPDPLFARLEPGAIEDRGRDGVVVGAATGSVRLGEVAPAGKAMMAAESWVRGARLAAGDRLL